MATAEGGAAREPNLAVTRFVHAMPTLCVLNLVTSVPAWLDWHAATLRTVTDWVGMAAFFGLFAALGHVARTRLCVDCAKQTPLDPQAAIERHGWALFITHLAARRPLYSWLWLVGIMVLGIVAAHVTGVRLFYAPWDILFTLLCYSEWRHHFLQPWCPRCRGGWEDGGDPEFVPDPDPAEKATQ